MALEAIGIKSSHPLLGWLAGRPGRRVVSNEIAFSLASITTPKQAQEFVRSAGLEVPAQEGKRSDTTYAVHVEISDQVLLMRSPQFCLQHRPLDNLPWGTMLVNFLVPATLATEAAGNVFRGFQGMVNRFSDSIGAEPAIALAGYVQDREPESLAGASFRLFYSCEPNHLIAEITAVLRNDMTINDMSLPDDKKLRALEAWNSLPTLLRDIELPKIEPVLVDLRLKAR